MSTLDEPELFVKEDNSLVTNYLTICASALFSCEKISQKETDCLRIALSDTGISNDRQKSLLLNLASCQNDFLTLLFFRYGSKRLAHNIFVYTVSPYIKKFQVTLWEFAQAILQKSELYLNRYLQIYDQGQYIDDELALKFIVRTCEKIKDISSRWKTIDQDYLKFSVASYDPQPDENIISQLGMYPYKEDITPNADLELFAKTNSLIFYELTSLISDLNYQFSKNELIDDPLDMRIFHHHLKILLTKLRYPLTDDDPIEFSSSHRIEFEIFTRLELMRLAYVEGLAEVHSAFKNWLLVLKQNLRALPYSSDLNSPDIFEMSYHLKQALLFEMVVAGSSAKDAELAVDRLTHYLKNHRVLPNHVLTGELSRIDPHLTPKTLELIQKKTNYYKALRPHTTKSGEHNETLEKSDFLNKSKELSCYFNDKISKLASAIILIFFVFSGQSLTGCGLKADPQSDIPALRPEIQFKVNPENKFKLNSLRLSPKYLKVNDDSNQNLHRRDASQ